jgi:ribosomal protein S18 acetylase RimI-like enzyme
MMTDGIRRATANDYGAYVVLLRELGVDDPTPSSERFAADLAPSILIYERDGAPIGYVSYDKLAANGYIRNLVVAPGARGAGIGAALMTAAASRLRARGVTSAWHLNVKADNTAAIRLYERLGMRAEHRSVALRFAWANLDRLPADATGVTVLPVFDGDDDDLERALGILAGRLQMTRSRGDRVTLQLRDEQLAPVGVACFDPAFPGAFPFCATRPALAALLLRALRSHARPGDLDLQIVIEDADALADALIAAGAAVRMRLLHYAGPLPGGAA